MLCTSMCPPIWEKARGDIVTDEAELWGKETGIPMCMKPRWGSQKETIAPS